jgi:DNA-binding CsgD family transcriptional regulator
MRLRRIILFFECYITQEGVAAILKEINNSISIIKVLTPNELKKIIISFDFDYILTDNQDIKEEEKFDSFLEKILFFETQKFENSNSINIFDKKHIIIKKISDFISEKNQENDNEISEREKEVIKYIALGLTNKEIAEKLFLSVHTVTTHRKNISNKLEIKTIPGLTIYAILNGIISIDETI